MKISNMPKKISNRKLRRSPEKHAGGILSPPLRSFDGRRAGNLPALSRSASEPAAGGERGEGGSWADGLLPRRRADSVQEMKVVVSVAVEGSPGPVRTMVRLAASVEEAVGAVVEMYGREGRIPRLQLHAAASFELHHSHFSLHSLNKRDKIGEVGGRSFYLRTNSSRHNSFSSEREASHADISARDIEIVPTADRRNTSPPASSNPFFFTIAQKLEKFERRTKRICRMVASIICA